MSITTFLYEEHLSGSEPDVDATTSDMHQLDLTDEPNSGPADLIHATSLYEESLSDSEPGDVAATTSDANLIDEPIVGADPVRVESSSRFILIHSVSPGAHAILRPQTRTL